MPHATILYWVLQQVCMPTATKCSINCLLALLLLSHGSVDELCAFLFHSILYCFFHRHFIFLTVAITVVVMIMNYNHKNSNTKTTAKKKKPMNDNNINRGIELFWICIFVYVYVYVYACVYVLKSSAIRPAQGGLRCFSCRCCCHCCFCASVWAAARQQHCGTFINNQINHQKFNRKRINAVSDCLRGC